MHEKETAKSGETLPSLEQLKGEQIGEFRGITLARSVFQLHLKGWKKHQIAQKLGITVTEVKYILYGPKKQ